MAALVNVHARCLDTRRYTFLAAALAHDHVLPTSTTLHRVFEHTLPPTTTRCCSASNAVALDTPPPPRSAIADIYHAADALSTAGP